MRIDFPRVVKVSLLRVKVGKRFRSRVRATERTIAVSSAFGLGLDEEREIVVVPETSFEINPGDVALISGESGSGKTIMLRLISSQLSKSREFSPVIWSGQLGVSGGELVVHGVGGSVEEALETLSHVGLNEAFIFLRRFRELSEGQRHRYLLAKAFNSGAKTIIIDDFCSPLDGVTARVVAYTAQKLARRRGLTFIAATTREDILEDLNPSLHIHKELGEKIKITRRKPVSKPCSIHREVKIRRTGVEAYKALSRFHYISGRLPPVRRVFAAYHRGEVVGVIVYSYPLPNHYARNLVFPWLRDYRPRERLRIVNRLFSRIARVIVHPRYRGIGLGRRMVEETLPRAGTPIVETLAVMARYNPFFEKAGMKKVQARGAEKTWGKLLKPLEELGFNLDLAVSKRYNVRVIKSLGKERVARLRRVVVRLAEALRRSKLRYIKPRIDDVESLAETIKRCIPRRGTVYLYWVRDDFHRQKYLTRESPRDE